MFIFDLSITLGLFIGIFDTLSRLKAFLKLVVSLLKTILVLPLLIGLIIIAVTKSMFGFAGLLHRKVIYTSPHPAILFHPIPNPTFSPTVQHQSLMCYFFLKKIFLDQCFQEEVESKSDNEDVWKATL